MSTGDDFPNLTEFLAAVDAVKQRRLLRSDQFQSRDANVGFSLAETRQSPLTLTNTKSLLLSSDTIVTDGGESASSISRPVGRSPKVSGFRSRDARFKGYTKYHSDNDLY